MTRGPNSDWHRQLTATKLDQPRVPVGLVERPQLVRRIVEQPVSLVLIDAPAGWGKSSLIAAWARSACERRPLAYLRLDPEDDDLRSFWIYVIAAMRRIDERLCDDFDDALANAGIDPVRSLLPAMINRIRAQDDPVVLVLDDYHVITDPEIHGTVDYLIENAPHNFQVAISTRSDPQLSLSRLRAHDALVEVRAADLRLSPEDTQTLLSERFGLAIELDLARVLCDRTEGWPAGIQLAALSLISESEPASFITSFAGDDRNIADYLTSEVLRRQSEKRRAFLLKTSILDEFNAELCDHLLDTTGSSGVLEELDHENLFLVPLDTRRHWFRYHHLFRDWLRHNHNAEATPEEVVELNGRAAEWLVDHSMDERAIAHHVTAGDTATAASTMEALLRRLPFISHAPIRNWLAAIPDDVALTKPAICMARVSRSLAMGDFDAAALAVGSLNDAMDAVDDPTELEILRPQAQIYRALCSLVMNDTTAAERDLQAVVEREDLTRSTPRF